MRSVGWSTPLGRSQGSMNENWKGVRAQHVNWEREFREDLDGVLGEAAPVLEKNGGLLLLLSQQPHPHPREP